MGPHRGQPVAARGASIAEARALVVLVHGRGASAENILALADDLNRPRVAYRAPQAAGSTWYPKSFLAPLQENEPGISSGLDAIGTVLEQAELDGIPPERHILLGFSQGACLTLEYVARNPRRFGGVIAFTGGLIGPPGTNRSYPGSLEDTPVFLGSSDPDPHVPWSRVEETAQVLSRMGAAVTLRRYPGMGHTINFDEIEAARGIIDSVIDAVEELA